MGQVNAHRPSTIVSADNILVLEAGRLVEQGTHGQLLEKNGLYASHWNRQRQAEKAREELAEALANDRGRITDGRLVAERDATERVGRRDTDITRIGCRRVR